MKSKIIITSLTFFLGIFAFNCKNWQEYPPERVKNSQSVQNLTGEELSRLDKEVTVRFPAILIKRTGTNCIELFASDDFKKYNGDGKYSIFSRIAAASNLPDTFEEREEVIVTGKMTFIKNIADTSKTCGIVTGKLFEISNIESF